ncbi:MAG: ribonuclease HIII [Candidatus Syntrophosphaera sp.]
MHKQIGEHLAALHPELAKRGISISSQREIAYGVQLRLEKGSENATLNIYYSLKKGLSQVIGAPAGSELKAELEEICRGKDDPVGAFHTWERWIGSDECGKGDYFGALVVAAFAMDRDLEADLAAMGVLDSKRLNDRQIKEIAHQLYEKYNDRISCIVIKPVKYNEIIADMQTRKQNLNDLLAWQHGTAILNLLEKVPKIQGILADQFSRQKKVAQFLKGREVTIPVEERPKAESDPAVAAASIIARYQFIQSRAAMDRRYGMKFPLGSGRNVLKPAKAFADKYGWTRLAEVAKLHFITSRDVRAREIFDSVENK